jgi:hypothetical protein
MSAGNGGSISLRNIGELHGDIFRTIIYFCCYSCFSVILNDSVTLLLRCLMCGSSPCSLHQECGVRCYISNWSQWPWWERPCNREAKSLGEQRGLNFPPFQSSVCISSLSTRNWTGSDVESFLCRSVRGSDFELLLLPLLIRFGPFQIG